MFNIFINDSWAIDSEPIRARGIIVKYLANFLKTNLAKFAAIWVKNYQKAGFLRPIRSKITLAKGKDRRKSIYIGNSFWRTKNCLTEEVYLAVTFSKIQLDICKIYWVCVARQFLLSAKRNYFFRWYIPVQPSKNLVKRGYGFSWNLICSCDRKYWKYPVWC